MTLHSIHILHLLIKNGLFILLKCIYFGLWLLLIIWLRQRLIKWLNLLVPVSLLLSLLVEGRSWEIFIFLVVFLRALPHTLVITKFDGHRANSATRISLLFTFILALPVLLRLWWRSPCLDAIAIYGLHRPDLIMIESFHDLILLPHLHPIQLIFLLFHLLSRVCLQCALDLVLNSLESHILVLMVVLFKVWELLADKVCFRGKYHGCGGRVCHSRVDFCLILDRNNMGCF